MKSRSLDPGTKFLIAGLGLVLGLGLGCCGVEVGVRIRVWVRVRFLSQASLIR